MDTTSYFHPRASAFTPATISLGVIFGPEMNFRGSVCPVASSLTCVPPMSTASTFANVLGLPEGSALRVDHLHELVPRVHEGLRTFLLQLCREGIDVDAGLAELGQDGFAVAAVVGHRGADLSVVGKRLQRAFRHRVHGERRRERLDVKHI